MELFSKVMRLDDLFLLGKLKNLSTSLEFQTLVIIGELSAWIKNPNLQPFFDHIQPLCDLIPPQQSS
jgi:hypothetical protein